MDRWRNKIAVVTGASAGIGAQIAVDLTEAGMLVYGLARRAERVELLRARIAEPKLRANLVALRCDVAQPAQVRAAFAQIAERHGSVQVLINNAGCARYGSLLAPHGGTATVAAAGDKELRSVLETNVLGAVHCIREMVRLLDDGSAPAAAAVAHIVVINSQSGHRIHRNDAFVATMNVYPASKYGLTAATECVRRELSASGRKGVRVSSISPGLTESDIFEASGFPNADGLIEQAPHLKAADISAAVLYVLSAPQHVNVNEIQIVATGGSS